METIDDLKKRISKLENVMRPSCNGYVISNCRREIKLLNEKIAALQGI